MMHQLMNGVVIGIVKSLEDPKKLGRVEVHFPWLSDKNKTYWARIATLMGGKGRGSWFMPEKEDEVLVAFEQGDIQSPCIVGFLWNGVDKPPNEDINPSVRRLRTVSGHVLEFDDNSGKERIMLKTQHGHEVEMVDPGQGGAASIRIETKGKQMIKLDDQPQTITIKTAATGTITIGPTGITINTPTGAVSVNCLQASISATTALNITAPYVQFNGIAQSPAFLASVYNPAIGNLFGA
jgi:uncharacterized protein involved in type VI secretion and phage assembly